MASVPLLIIYATVTGNAEDVAERVAREALRRHYTPTVMSAHAFLRALDTLPSWRAVVWVASTTGQGEAPPTLRALWRALLRRSLPHNLLAGQAAAVFGLGDSGYTHYNVVAKKLYRRLEGLGALMLGPAGLGDDRAAGGHEAALAPWLTDLWHRLRAQVPLTPGLTEAAPEDRYTRPTCKWAVEVCAASPSPPEGAPAQAAEAGGCRAAVQSAALAAHVAIAEMEDEAALASVPGAGEMWGVGQGAPPPHAHDSPARPLTARVAATRRMTAPDHWQDVRHLELEVPGAEYEPGDVLSVLPRQDPAAVVAFIERCGAGLAPGTTVEVRRLAPGPETAGPAPRHLRLGDLVAGALDVAAASPRRTFFEVLRDTARSGLERERLEYLCSAEGLEDLATYNQLEGRTVLEVLQDFPSARPDLGWLLTAVPRLAPRAFSIASSPLAHPGAAHLTLAVVGWVTPFKRRRRGLCSAWLAGLRPGDELPAWTQRGALRLPPDPATPLVLVGPGTGVAPMRAFLQHREAQRRHGVPGVAPSLLFFGCRNVDKDCLYAEEWGRLRAGNILSLYSLAASRDQDHKIYVQDRIREAAAAVWEALDRGASVHVAGSADKMPADVASALADVLVERGGLPPEEASRVLQRWQATGRYQVEAWS
ncbi:NFR1 [Auxenochlorella protothecoides x Auxenochlorella symbiontica]